MLGGGDGQEADGLCRGLCWTRELRLKVSPSAILSSLPRSLAPRTSFINTNVQVTPLLQLSPPSFHSAQQP